MNYLLATSILMASVVEANEDSKFPNSRFGKTEFLTSIRDFCPDGVQLGVEKVSRLFPTPQNPEKGQVAVEFTIMSDMPKSRLFALDENGEYILQKDELTGKESRKIVLEEVKGDDLETITLFLPCGTPKEISNEADLTFYPSSSAYPLFKLALQEAGELPEDMGNKPFATTQEELKEALEGFTFIGKCEEIKGTYHYFRLQAEKL